jgi:hypothetical protein
MKTRGAGSTDTPFLTSALGGGRRVSFPSRQLYPRARSPRYPLARMCVCQSRPYRREENFLSLPGIELRPHSLPPVVVPTELTRLLCTVYMCVDAYVCVNI